MNVPLRQTILTVLRQGFLDGLSGKYLFGVVDSPVLKVAGQFRGELSPNEAHSYAYLLENKGFSVTRNEVQEKVKDLRAH